MSPVRTNAFTATYAYDGMNRLASKTYNDNQVQSPYVATPWVALTYDQGGAAARANGKLTQTFANYVQYNRNYDAMGRVVSSSQITGGSIYNMSYAYNLAGQLTAFSYPSGRVATMSYDAADRISQVQDAYNGTVSTHASAIAYWPNRVISSMTLGHPNVLGATLSETTTLNSRLQVSNRNVQIGSLYPVQLAFTYGTSGMNNGNLSAQSIQTTAAPNPPPGITIPALNLKQTYGYDAYDRLLSAAETGGTSEWSQNYLYDQWGNRAVKAGSYLPNANGTPSALSQFTNNRWSATGTAYDSAGDATGVPGKMNETFTYDGEYRVNTANAGGVVTYVYDGEGRRVQKTTAPSTFTTTYVYDTAGKVILESLAPASGLPPKAPFTGTEYLTTDHLGSTRLALNNEGQVVKRYDFLPFGEELWAGTGGRGADYEPSGYAYPTTPDTVLRKFTGKERDAETGLDYFGARYFSGAQGRFTSPDAPFADQHAGDPQSWNLYGYVRNNPLGNSNPNGKGACGVNVSSCADYIAGGLKAIANIPSDVDSSLNRAVNLVISPFTSYQFPDAPSFQATNADERQGMEAASAVMLVSPAAELGAAKAAAALGAETGVDAAAAVSSSSDVPTSIPAGPSARPTAAQQKAINAMGEAHGCSTCGSTAPGTASGNWVGDHQPPTALNRAGGAQVYQPQCIQCSRQQGGAVAAELKRAKKPSETPAN